MIVTVKPGADLGRVQRALAGAGLWTRAASGSVAGPAAGADAGANGAADASANGAAYASANGAAYGGAAAGFALVEVEAHSTRVAVAELLSIEGVAGVSVPPSAHPKVDGQASQVEVAGVALGAGAPAVLMGGPCCVESESLIEQAAEAVAAAGGKFLRGGAYKPRTSPYSFAGHGEPALRWLRQAAERNGLRSVTECLKPEDAGLVAEYAQLVQVGSRNMQNFSLLAAVGATGRPVLLKRSAAATVEEWLLAGEHCLAHGAAAVIFCERGIRSFDPSVRNFLDLGAVALLSQVLHQPVVVDPSHAVGRRDLIAPLSHAALGAGAHGLLIETHPDPARALSDGPQALPLQQFAALARSLRLA